MQVGGGGFMRWWTSRSSTFGLVTDLCPACDFTSVCGVERQSWVTAGAGGASVRCLKVQTHRKTHCRASAVLHYSLNLNVKYVLRKLRVDYRSRATRTTAPKRKQNMFLNQWWLIWQWMAISLCWTTVSHAIYATIIADKSHLLTAVKCG